jgi:two-component system, NarL family, response regulator NreC
MAYNLILPYPYKIYKMENNKITVIIADDHEIFRDGLSMLLQSIDNVQLLGEAKDGAELIQLVALHKPNVVLTDIKMPKIDGVEATKEIIKTYPNTSVIALTMHDDGQQIVEMIEAGAIGYLVKNASKDEMIDAIITVNEKESYYCKVTSNRITKLIARRGINPMVETDKVTFKPIELEIIQQICNGLTSKEIGNIVHLSYRTVEGYRTKIQEKMEVDNIANIIKYAFKHKLITLE